MNLKIITYVLTYLLLLMKIGDSKENKFLYCAVCRFMVDEINLNIEKVDPEETIEVGSFRLDSHGKQSRTQVPYARSSAHLSETIADICYFMDEYAKTLDSQGREILVKMYDRVGVELSQKNVVRDAKFSSIIKSYCDAIIEEYEEEILNIFKENKENLESLVCKNTVDVCTDEDLKEPLPVLEEKGEDILTDEEQGEIEEEDKNPADEAKESDISEDEQIQENDREEL